MHSSHIPRHAMRVTTSRSDFRHDRQRMSCFGGAFFASSNFRTSSARSASRFEGSPIASYCWLSPLAQADLPLEAESRGMSPARMVATGLRARGERGVKYPREPSTYDLSCRSVGIKGNASSATLEAIGSFSHASVAARVFFQLPPSTADSGGPAHLGQDARTGGVEIMSELAALCGFLAVMAFGVVSWFLDWVTRRASRSPTQPQAPNSPSHASRKAPDSKSRRSRASAG